MMKVAIATCKRVELPNGVENDRYFLVIALTNRRYALSCTFTCNSRHFLVIFPSSPENGVANGVEEQYHYVLSREQEDEIRRGFILDQLNRYNMVCYSVFG